MRVKILISAFFEKKFFRRSYFKRKLEGVFLRGSYFLEVI
jgi:hypothetical protein